MAILKHPRHCAPLLACEVLHEFGEGPIHALVIDVGSAFVMGIPALLKLCKMYSENLEMKTAKSLKLFSSILRTFLPYLMSLYPGT